MAGAFFMPLPEFAIVGGPWVGGGPIESRRRPVLTEFSAAVAAGGDRVWGMGPRLILSNAQKSAGTHTPNPVGWRCGKYDENPTGLDVGSAAIPVSQSHGPVWAAKWCDIVSERRFSSPNRAI